MKYNCIVCIVLLYRPNSEMSYDHQSKVTMGGVHLSML